MSQPSHPLWLVADCGNTDLKLALVNPHLLTVSHHHRFTGPVLRDPAALVFAIEALIAQWPVPHGGGVVWTRSHSPVSQWFESWVNQSIAGQFGAACPIGPGHYSSLVDTSAYGAGQLGADRLANVVAATVLFPGQASLIADFGTATNFDLVSAQGHYEGGLLIPGWETTAMALSAPVPGFTDRLQTVLDDPLPLAQAFGLDTQAGLAVGLSTGYQSMVSGCLAHLTHVPATANVSAPSPSSLNVLATGGLTAHPQWNEWLGSLFGHTLPSLTLLGLSLLAQESSLA